MDILIKFWNNFKNQPDVWFFYGFIVSFTLTIRKVLFFYPIRDQFNEYSGIYLYLSDLFLIAAVFLWITSLLKKEVQIAALFKTVPRGTKLALQSFLFLVIWSFISIIWSENQNIAIFRSIKLFEFFLLFGYVIFNVSRGTIPKSTEREFTKSNETMKQDLGSLNNTDCDTVPRGTFLRNILRIIIGVAIFQSIVGIWQFLIQQSIGLVWLQESIISPEIPGVAKIVLDGEKFIRSYGLFPHPNIFGGFLVFSLIATILYRRLFHARLDSASQVEHSQDTYNSSTPTLIQRAKWNISIFFRFSMVMQIAALLLTFSKSAIIGFLIALAYLCISHAQNASHGKTNGRETRNDVKLKKMFHVEHCMKKLLILLIIAILLVIIIKPDFYSLFLKSLNERLLYLNVSRETLSNPTIFIFGIGNGQFISHLLNFPDILDWQFQPIHNVFLTIVTELGIIGLIAFLVLVWNLFHVEQVRQSNGIRYEVYFKALFLAYLFVMLFDHYLWDIQQGQLLFWITAGLLLSKSEK